MGIFATNSVIWLLIISFDLVATLPTSTPSTMSVITNGFVCTIKDGKIYVNDVYTQDATAENVKEVKVYNAQMRQWAKSLHDTMYKTMKKMVNDMFGERGAFWQHLYGPFWEVVNAYGTDSNLMNPILIPLQQRKYQKEVALQLPEIPPYPDPPSFCNYEME